MNWDDDSVSEKDIKNVVAIKLEQYHTTKDRVIPLQIDVTLKECEMVTWLLSVMRSKK